VNSNAGSATGATTFSITTLNRMTFSKTTLIIKGLFVTLSLKGLFVTLSKKGFFMILIIKG
jgi:hypothetical protein